MKRNNPNSSDKNRNNNNSSSNNSNNSRNRGGKEANNISKDCAAFKCKVANSCTSTNKTVQDIERYTREAENLVEALSALTKLAEQLKPCLPSKSRCSQSESSHNEVSSNSSSTEENKYVGPHRRDIEEQDSEPKVHRPKRRAVEEEERTDPVVTKRHVVHLEETKVVSKVRSEPERVKTQEETKDYCLCHCSSLQQNKFAFREDEEDLKGRKQNEKKKREKDSDDDKSGCCLKKKSSCCSKKKAKEKQDIVEFKPLPMPPMTVVQPVEEPPRLTLQPALTYDAPIEERATVYPTVPARTTKAALNLDDKEMQTSFAYNKQAEMGSMTEPVQFAGGRVNQECATSCTTRCGTVDMCDVGTVKETITLNAIPFEEYAEKDFYQYWYDEAVNCKCPSEMDSEPMPAPPPNTPNVRSGSPQLQPEQKRQQQQPPYQQEQQPLPHQSMMDCYPYYHGGQKQPAQSMQYQHFPNQMKQQMEYTEYRFTDTQGSRPAGINAANYNPPGRMMYRACRPNGMGTDSDLDCAPSCVSATGTSRVSAPSNTGSNAPSVGQAEYRAPAGKKAVQYQDQRYNYYKTSQGQAQYPMQNAQNSFSPCYENIPQRPGMMGRQQEANPATRNSHAAYERQISNIMSTHYNTLFVDKADKDLAESFKNDRPATKRSRTNSADDQQCNGSCPYQAKPKDGKR